MKDSLFQLLLSFFEKTIMHLKEQQETDKKQEEQEQLLEVDELLRAMPRFVKVQLEQLQSPGKQSVRIFTRQEQLKLTKASQQLLVRLVSWGILSPELMELIVNRLVFSESQIVGLQETKWMIRNTLAGTLSSEQLAFLDLVLYQKEDGQTLH